MKLCAAGSAGTHVQAASTGAWLRGLRASRGSDPLACGTHCPPHTAERHEGACPGLGGPQQNCFVPPGRHTAPRTSHVQLWSLHMLQSRAAAPCSGLATTATLLGDAGALLGTCESVSDNQNLKIRAEAPQSPCSTFVSKPASLHEGIGRPPASKGWPGLAPGLGCCIVSHKG